MSFYNFESILGTFADRESTHLQSKIALTVTSVPSYISKNEYFPILIPQVVDLVMDADTQNDMVREMNY